MTSPVILADRATIAVNGIPWKPYVYRGTGRDELTPWMDDEPGEPVKVPRGRPATQPCGTPAAYRRHQRHGERPCRECEQGRLRDEQDNRNVKRRARRNERYEQLRAAGYSPAQATRLKDRRAS